jgi:transcription termination/antitermination protein NusA
MIPRPSPDEAWRFVNKLFKNEVPEIASGVVEIRAVARLPGIRCKLAIYSHDDTVDGVAACMGPRGSRIQRVVEQLGGERIDLFPWVDSPERLIALALAPAKTEDVVLDQQHGRALVLVHDHQLPVASGRDGVNRELASEVTGWDIQLVVRNDAA